jgi:hypothetical protein
MAVNEKLVEKLASLSLEELEEPLEAVKTKLEKNNQLKVAKEIIERYKPALKELGE